MLPDNIVYEYYKNDINVSTSNRKECDEWIGKLPYINFKSHWNVKVIPPFAGAVIRFLVSYGDREVSVYMDGYNILGFYYNDDDIKEPYWEIYPTLYDDTERFALNDVKGLIEGISNILDGEKICVKKSLLKRCIMKVKYLKNCI